MRILHFSDIHVGMRLREVPIRRWFGKRALGGLNLLLERARRFKDNPLKLRALSRFARENGIDLVVFTGDYTALGLEREMGEARQRVEPLMQAPLGFVNVPGNHDFYVPESVRARRFERHFGDTLRGDLDEFRVEGPWPLVRLIDETVAVVAVNSARPNAFFWRSSGRVPPAQLEALRRIVSDPRVRDRFVLVVTHYAPRLADGRRDRLFHRMINDNEFLTSCAAIPRGAILCGHVHWRYCVRVPAVNLPVFCSGSTTMEGREGLWVHEVDGERARAVPGRWDGEAYVLETDAALDC